jgi:hypothetical protein
LSKFKLLQKRGDFFSTEDLKLIYAAWDSCSDVSPEANDTAKRRRKDMELKDFWKILGLFQYFSLSSVFSIISSDCIVFGILLSGHLSLQMFLKFSAEMYYLHLIIWGNGLALARKKDPASAAII